MPIGIGTARLGILVLATPAAPPHCAQGAGPDSAVQRMLLRLFLEGDFASDRFGPARWLDGGRAYTTLEPSEAIAGARHRALRDGDGARTVYVPAGALVPEGGRSALDIDDYAWSPDGSMLLVVTNSERVWRVNSATDWVYEEEFSLRVAFRWSADGRTIAYWQLDMSGVRDFLLINNTDSLYSYMIPVQYPKAGTTNSAVRAGAMDACGRSWSSGTAPGWKQWTTCAASRVASASSGSSRATAGGTSTPSRTRTAPSGFSRRATTTSSASRP